jgi:CRP-like cAMP-binding protein
MYDSLIQYINQRASQSLTELEIEKVKAAFTIKRIRKKQYFLQEGDVSKYGGFIVKGAMRQYSIDDKGVEHILHLYIENYWVSDRESSIMLTPSKYNIDAWEDTELLIIARAEMLDLMDKIPALVQMIRHMDERSAIASQRRLSSSISNTAEKRYSELANTYPEFLKRFPQHIIASYLGVTPETLSRIRNHAVTK